MCGEGFVRGDNYLRECSYIPGYACGVGHESAGREAPIWVHGIVPAQQQPLLLLPPLLYYSSQGVS